MEIDPRDALAAQRAGALLIDIRDPPELLAGVARAATTVQAATLLAAPGQWIDGPDREVLLICGSGKRSLRAAQTLHSQGYGAVQSVRGGLQAWHRLQLPVSVGDLATADFHERYDRHIKLNEIGVVGQRRLLQSRVTLIGAGGLGSPAATYLAAAGVGTLRLIDPDVVDRSNLQRQILHRNDGVGMLKVQSAEAQLRALNPGCLVEPVAERIDAHNVDALLCDADVVIDGCDDLPTRYVVSDACVRLGKPLVYGAIERYVGQVSVFDAGRARGHAPCYRCLFPADTTPAALSCAQAGVLGVLPGVIGVLQATEALKIILAIGTTLSGRLLQFDALTMRFRETKFGPDPTCAVCAVTDAGATG